MQPQQNSRIPYNFWKFLHPPAYRYYRIDEYIERTHLDQI